MKTFSIPVAAVLLVAVLAACGRSDSADRTGSQGASSSGAVSQGAALIDGTYQAAYDSYDRNGWKPQLTLTVRGGRIVSAAYDYVDRNGQMKSRNDAYGTQMKSVSGVSPAEAAETLNERIVELQSVPVEAVTGATTSSRHFNELASAAVAQARSGSAEPVVLPLDETYTVQAAEPDERGWRAVLSVRYEDGNIASVDYDEVNAQNQKKSADTAYAERMKAASGVSHTEAYERLERQLLETQNPEELDTVTGATSTSNKFIELADRIRGMR